MFLYCHTAQAFQDVPFSLPFTFQALDLHFPGSRFILSMRDNPEQWYRSVINSYSVLFAQGRPPSLADLKAASYLSPGWLYRAHLLMHDIAPDDPDPFNRERLVAGYEQHNRAVREYFRHRPQDLLVLNVAEPGAYQKLCAFLGKPALEKDFPWQNKTSERKAGG